jgi:cytochrome c biogenesis protein CcmG/thiol:disulfide interchange protein DsbE
VSKSRQERRSERLEQRREERDARRSNETSSKRNLWLALGGALVIGVVVVGALAIGLGQEDSVAPSTAAAGTGTGANASVSTDGDFPIVAYQGADALGASELDFTELLGQGRPVVLNFWAGQCPPCRAEMPAFQRVYDQYGSDFLLVGVDIGPYIGLGSNQSAIDLLAELDITYPAAQALDARAVQDYSVLGMPTTIFYDGDGAEVSRQVGLLTEDALESRVRELVGA